ncbi:hypothetical protein L3476_19725 [Paenibacillus thiaminolyticus]|uniref:hypothetical protein n=1 Tax=Paenibacillus thiaminolyticus TaxID=49283 RepID=UPI00234FCDF1|nr:hypothetical protein [Paenibacillus thiaminolyticus]WCR25551.1 hypothetical protein L3476_19725 [Paenibacillus thiaminolyticus]
MSSHREELLHSYIILGPSKLSRRETGEIPAVLQDSLCGKVVHIELLYSQDFAYGIGVSGEIVQFCRFRLPDRRVKGNGAVFRPLAPPVFYKGVEIVHFPTQNSAPIAF